MMKMKEFLMIVFVLVLTLAVPAGAIEIIFQNGIDNGLDSDYQGTEDTWLSGGGGGEYGNMGATEQFYVGSTATAILKWDISALKSLAGPGEYVKIHSAKVDVVTRGSGYADIAEGMDVHLLKPANHDWIEGDGGDYAGVGEPCWYFRKVVYVGPDPDEAVYPGLPDWRIGDPWTAAYPDGSYGPTPLEWTGDGWFANGALKAGFDYDPEVLANIKTEDNMSENFEGPFQFLVPAEAVQEWVYGNNAGLLFKCHDDDEPVGGPTKFISSEYAPGEQTYPHRPKLTVTYTIETGNEPSYGDFGSIKFQVGLYNQFDTDPNVYCPRFEGAQDNFLWLYGSSRNYNHGHSYRFMVGGKAFGGSPTANAIVKWDISDLNSLAGPGERVVIENAYVVLNDRGEGHPDDPNGFEVYAIKPANADWVEGTQRGSWATTNGDDPGDSTWNFLEVTAAFTHLEEPWEGVNWAGGAGRPYSSTGDPLQGCSVSGVDFYPEVIAQWTTEHNGLDTHYGTYDFEVPRDIVQEWLDVANAGLTIRPFDTIRPPDSGLQWMFSSDYAQAYTSAGDPDPNPYLAIPAWLTHSGRPLLGLTYSIGDEGDTGGCDSIAADMSGPGGVPDCYVDMYDYAKFASEWAEDETQ